MRQGVHQVPRQVHEGIIRDGNRNWFLGDAALEIAPMKETPGRNDDAFKKLAQYADEIGVKFDVLRNCRLVASSWPSAYPLADTPWKVHQMLMAEENRHLIKPGMTVTQASEALRYRNVGRTWEP